MHYSPLGWYPDSPAAALAVLWNTQNVSMVATVTLPLYYAGFLSGSVANVEPSGGNATNVTLVGFDAVVSVPLPALGVAYLVVNPA